jgi:DNA mismatch repair ATPase MutS
MADIIKRNSLLLCNESFAATNEREGSEIAGQITGALVESGIKVFFVTHLYEFARGVYDKKMANAMFLRAERRADGVRTFRVLEGEPLQTSYGDDLYKRVFNAECSPDVDVTVQLPAAYN